MIEEKELWLPVLGYEGFYEVSSLGNVRSLARINGRKKTYGQILSKIKHCVGLPYEEVTLKVAGRKRMTKKVHRLVAESFLKNPNNLPAVNHIDFNPLNNKVDNLEWCDATHNIRHSLHRRRDEKGKHGKKIVAYKGAVKIGDFGSIRDAARKLNCHGQNICAQLSGKIKQCKGFTFSEAPIQQYGSKKS